MGVPMREPDEMRCAKLVGKGDDMSNKKQEAAAMAQRRMRWFYAALAALAVAGVTAIGFALAGQRAGAAVMEPVDLSDVADARTLMELAKPETIGPADAPVKLLVFNDFECPFCAQFALQVKPALKERFVDEGKLQIVYYDFPLSNRVHSFAAARAARCAGDQDRFWEYHDLLLAEQASWSRRSNALGDLVSYAERLGLDTGEFSSCVRSDRHARLVTANLRLGEQLGVRGTPTIYVNGKRAGNWNYASLSRQIAAELGE
jgi:protein-disulfide isomerase